MRLAPRMWQNNLMERTAENIPGRKVYSVGELNREIKVILNDVYPDVWVKGEVSNFKTYPSGHLYFSLKDAEGQISAVIFSGARRFKLEDGLCVIAHGKIDVYPPRGNYQFIISEIEPAGKGALQLAFEQLKAKLENEGLFAAERKRPIPAFVQRIGIVTSRTGAALHDILTVIERRFANVQILIYPVRVQGDEAKYEIVEAIEYLNRSHPELEVLLVGRGGGSYEDLWAFNEEMVARAISSSTIPVISCVGHEVDFTIADFVADLRAPTPSAAAELVVKNKADVSRHLEQLSGRLNLAWSSVYNDRTRRLQNSATSRAMSRPQEIFEERMQQLDHVMQNMISRQNMLVERGTHRLSLFSSQLDILSPLSTVKRGYAVCRDQNNSIVTSTRQLHTGSIVSLGFKEGKASATIETLDHNGSISAPAEEHTRQMSGD